MNHDYPPTIAIPHDLDDEAAVTLLEFLYELARIIENHYAAQLRRYHRQPADNAQADLWTEQNPPF